ncbi:MAG: prepilin-type N-terminal cleavage/methylation domain-containing protein [bacterium]
MNLKKIFMTKKKSPYLRDAGVTLVELIVALGIFGILVLVVGTVYVQEAVVKRKLDDQMNEIEVIRRILYGIDCDATKVSNCALSPYIALRSVTSSNPVLVRAFDSAAVANTTKIGNYLVRAKCGPDHKIRVEIQDSRSPSSSWESITDKVPLGCYMP